MNNADTNYADLFFSSIPNDVDTLEKNVKEFPFSSVARFLLLYNYKKNNNPAFANLAKQTGIYINTPFWLQYQLSKIGERPFSTESEILNINTEENISLQANQPRLPAAFGQEITQIPVSENENISEVKNDSFEEENQNENIEQNFSEAGDQQITQISVLENEGISEVKNDSFEEENKNENTEENFSEAAEEPRLPEAFGQGITQIPVSENENISEVKNDFYEEENQNENIDQNFSEAASQQLTQIPVLENENTNEVKNVSFEEENQNENTEENFSEAADQQLTQIPLSENEMREEKVSENSEEDLIAFEPLHTVDYFASQGIKISEEALENDHLGKQVKSFTAWLKSMKKLHPGQLPEQNEVIEKIIQASAEVSNQNANVLTEAMAEVLIKQNKKEKAIEMYQKLSLINPSKSAYFAAKIESLKII